MGKKIKIGLDFDGVVAYNPARVVRPYVKWFKRRLLRKKGLTFMIPKSPIMKLVWILVHESSIFPAKGTKLLKQLAKDNNLEIYLITGRFPILENNLKIWLRRNHLEDVFKNVHINRNIEQPHEFKLKMIKTLGLDWFVEDNWDIVDYLKDKTKTKIIWVYNFADRKKEYIHKVPYLEKALERIVK